MPSYHPSVPSLQAELAVSLWSHSTPSQRLGKEALHPAAVLPAEPLPDLLETK